MKKNTPKGKTKGWMKFRVCPACGKQGAKFWTLTKCFACDDCKDATFALAGQIFYDAVMEYQEKCREKEAETRAKEEKEKSSSSSESTSESKPVEDGKPEKEQTMPT